MPDGLEPRTDDASGVEFPSLQVSTDGLASRDERAGSTTRVDPPAGVPGTVTAVLPAAPVEPAPQARRVDLATALSDPSRHVGRYVVLEELGRGGMGVVYRAHDTKTERPVALKMLLDPARAGLEQVRRFQREGSSRPWRTGGP